MRKLVTILGTPIDNLDMAETLDRLDEFVVIGRETGKTHQVVTVNADFVVNAIKDPELRFILQQADLATADGMPLVWGARLLNVPLKGRIAGADMVPLFAERAATKGYSIYLLGAAPGVAARAAELLQERSPGLIIAGVYSPPLSSVLEMEAAVVEQIREARPDILYVAFGNPKQEKWIAMHAPELKVPVMMGVGGSLDFITGYRKRAPEWMQRVGLEWVFRLLQEPRRLWRRYVVDLAVFGIYFMLQWWRMRRGRSATQQPAFADIQPEADRVLLQVQGSLTINDYQKFWDAAQTALKESPHLVVDLSHAEFLDSAAIGALIGLARQARDAGGDVFLANVPAEITGTLSLLKLDQFFVCLATANSKLPDPKSPVRVQASVMQLDNLTWWVAEGPRLLDAETALAFSSRCQEMLEENSRLMVDLSPTVFLASAGLAVLVRLHKLAAELGGELRLAGCSKDVRTTIEMIGLDKVLTIYNGLPHQGAAPMTQTEFA